MENGGPEKLPISDGFYDVIVVGAGVAGLTAATMLGRMGRSVLVISKPLRRNSVASSVNNVPYADGRSPGEIYEKMEYDARRYGVTILWDEVMAAKTLQNHVLIEGRADGIFRTKRLLLATGRIDELPEWLPDGTWGKTAFDCPYCHTCERSGGRFVCVGKGVETLKMAALARDLAGTTIIVVSDSSAHESRLAQLLRRLGLEVLLDRIVSASLRPEGEIRMETTTGRLLVADTLLLGDIVRPNRRLADDLDLDLDDEGFPETTQFGMTSNPLVYSAGNVEGSPYFMWTGAASSGINAARAICEDLAFGSAMLEDWS